MPKKGENIYKRKDGRWEGRYIRSRESGRTLYGYVYGRTYREVKEKQRRAVQKMQTEENSTAAQQTCTMQMLAEKWFYRIKPQVKESTYRKYWNLWTWYIEPTFGHLLVSQVKNQTVELFCSQLRTSGGVKQAGLSAKTVSATLSLLRSMFHLASRLEIPVTCDLQAWNIRQEQKSIRVFTAEEQRILCAYLTAELSLKNAGILMCLFTGVRIGELCALRWEDIHLKHHVICIRHTMQRLQTDDGSNQKTRVIITSPKSSHSIRTIPLPESFSSLLASLVPPSGTGYFLTGSEQRWIEPRSMQNHFKRVLQRCQISPANFHTLRHTFATRCIEVGFDVKSLSEILGHANVSITMNRYVHPSMDLKRDQMQKLSPLFAVK